MNAKALCFLFLIPVSGPGRRPLAGRNRRAPLGPGLPTGRLTDTAGNPANSACDFQFSLWNDPDAGA